MNENINLCEILKGHEDETFYSPIYGNMVLIKIDDRYPYPLYFNTNVNNTSVQTFNSDGKPCVFCAECLLFPSKEQRDWNKWLEEQKLKVPKTWEKLKRSNTIYTHYSLNYIVDDKDYFTAIGTNLIEKSALALLKIHQLIEVGYGGNKIKTSNNNVHCIIYDFDTHKFITCVCVDLWRSHISFHTKKQAEEFLSYPENVELLKDYFMI